MIRLFRVFVPVGTLALLAAEIIIMLTAFVVASYLVLEVDPTDYLLYDGGLMRIVVVLLSILISLYFQDLYSNYLIESRILLLQQLSMAIGTAILIQGIFSYISRDLRTPLRLMLTGCFLSLAGVFAWRLAFNSYALKVVGRTRLLLLGGSESLEDLAQHVVEHPELGLAVAGYVDDCPRVESTSRAGRLLGPVAELRRIVAETDPGLIVVGMSERRNCVPVADLLELRFGGHAIEEVSSAYERVTGRVSLKELRPSQLIYSGELEPRRQTLLYQRVFNLVVATIGIVLTSPLMLLTALAVRLSSPGPVLYRQRRVGLEGQVFTVYKFRSMRVNAEAGTGAVWASKNDPRITPVGRIIRRLRFDELPQLFNVLRGEMSLVGPRPERPEFVKALSEQIPYYRQRHYVPPGITGWAQINHKYGDTLEDTVTKLEYDLYYIKNMSVSLDIYIVFHTLKTMLLTRGAQ
ncbi:MAG: sugar transferase [Bryobacteraceae bacterium]|jgi:sugar transferase (PEP-CTERM system associated)